MGKSTREYESENVGVRFIEPANINPCLNVKRYDRRILEKRVGYPPAIGQESDPYED